jgi:uncharacterized protein with von Willebrand factor type A (vWA) domain
VWKSNLRRRTETTSLMGRAAQIPQRLQGGDRGRRGHGPTEITHPGGSVEHWNEEAGGVWLRRMKETYPHLVWLNPTPEGWWPHTYSVQLVREIIGEERMFPLTLTGVDKAMKELAKRR